MSRKVKKIPISIEMFFEMFDLFSYSKSKRRLKDDLILLDADVNHKDGAINLYFQHDLFKEVNEGDGFTLSDFEELFKDE
ncbi:MAG: hypothetical protein ACFFBD_10135 [Candidatus Hodarchaeota archaeon]